jgi:hypothetical protein
MEASVQWQEVHGTTEMVDITCRAILDFPPMGASVLGLSVRARASTVQY